MDRTRNIFLVGMMGAGKTTIGRQLARRLNKRFVDCDHEIEARTGVKVPVIFEIEGEAGFRQREAQIIESLTRETDLILATGGGAVLDPQNRRHLKERGIVFYLRVPPRILYERTRHDRNRPLLQVPDPLGRLESLHADRDPLYRDVADLVIDGCVGTSGVLRRIEQELDKRCAA
ncbi:MAG TPA: shikimate kinase [Rhodocyclaceae bacterium]|nr:shikimate kinase [Rhodocyclaceae bacterium]HNH36361.1 shikimate kinase [Rhodocyclaceae bacterium]